MKKILIIAIVLIAIGAGVSAYAAETQKDNTNSNNTIIQKSNNTNTSQVQDSEGKSINSSNNNVDNTNSKINNNNIDSSTNANNSKDQNSNAKDLSQNNSSNSSANLNLNNINIPSGQDYHALYEKAQNIYGLVANINYNIYNALNNKSPNSTYNNLTYEEKNIIIAGTSEQKEKLINELGGNKLIINSDLNNYVPQEMTSIPLHPEYFANGQFYYAFAMTTLSNLCQSLNNWRQYYGLISCSGQILNADEINKLIQEHKIYHLTNSEKPQYPVLTFNFNN